MNKMKNAEEWADLIPKLPLLSNKPLLAELKTIELIKTIQLDAIQEGMRRAAKIISKRADDYDAEHGITDVETGTREYPRGGDEYLVELAEQSDAILTASETITL